MKLVNEILKYPFIISFILIFVTESLILIYIIFNYKSGYSIIIEPTKNISIKKANITLVKFNNIITNGLYKYLADLKMIGKHMSNFVLDEGEESGESINKNTIFYKNYENSVNREIIFADFEILSSVDYIKKFINYSDLYTFRFLDIYAQEFSHSDDPNTIIASLLSEHQELNAMSYYKYNGSIKDLSRLSRISVNYLISILKTIFIKRYLTKRNQTEYLHISLILKDEIFLYPPATFNNTYLIDIPSILRDCDCDYGSGITEKEFPKCIYNYINKEKFQMNRYNLPYDKPFILHTFLQFNFVIINICLTIPFIKRPDFKTHTYLPHVCIELNFTNLMESPNFENKEKIKIGIFTKFSFLNDLYPIFFSNKETYELIKEIYTDEKFGKYKINSEIPTQSFFYLFHFLYLDIFANESCYTQNVSIDNIMEEYKSINLEFLNKIQNLNSTSNPSSLEYFEIEKTGCQRNLFDENVTIDKDKYLIVISPIKFKYGLLDEIFLEIPDTIINDTVLYSFAIISTNPNRTESMFNNIVIIKIIRLMSFFFLSSFILLLLVFIFLRIFTEYKLEPINTLISLSENIEEFCKNDKLKIDDFNIVNENIEQNSKEALVLKNIYQNMFKTLLLKKIIEEKQIIDLDQKNTDEKNNIFIQNLYEITQSMNNAETKNICKWIISHYHYINGLYKYAEEELKSLISDIIAKEANLYNKNDIFDSQIKDKIGRYNKMAFLNEYSPLKINETLLPIIKIKILKQKVKYLYGLTKYNQGVLLNNNNNLTNNPKGKNQNKNNNINNNNINNNNNKNVIKNNFEKFYEAIECFNECKDISKLLGMNPIKQIYSHIMIAQCYIRMKIYKEAMMNLNEALTLFLELRKTFKDDENILFCPRIMLYIESLIFQTIMFNIVQAARILNKDNACGWLILKIFETSPFIFPNIHGECSNLIQSCLKISDKSNRYKDKFKKIFSKISARISMRKTKNKNTNSDSNSRSYNESNAGSSNLSSSFKGYISNLRTSSKSVDFTIRGISSYVTHKKQNYFKNKNIILCVSEKIIPKLNGMEIKDVLMKYFKKCFRNNEDDRFGFIQFSNNGKKTITIKPQRLNDFLQKLESHKNAFQYTESINYKKDTYFTEFYNLFDSIIKQQTAKCDYIIIMFINAEDIRFTSIKECVDIVNALNDNNYTVVLLSNDREINNEKILNINSLIYGLYDGYFIQINNYQRIKQILINFATRNKTDIFVNYDYECLENIL